MTHQTSRRFLTGLASFAVAVLCSVTQCAGDMDTPAYRRWGIRHTAVDARVEPLLVQAYDTLYALRFAKAETLYRRIVDLCDSSTEAHLGLALAYRYLGQTLQSYRASRRALELDSMVPAANFNCAEKIWNTSGLRGEELDPPLNEPERCSLALAYARRGLRSKHPSATYAWIDLWTFELGLGHLENMRTAMQALLKARHFPPFLMEFGYNVLVSVAPDATVFTDGDNDTYPLFAAQLAEAVGPGACIANVSLLNVPRYVRSYRDVLKAPISLSDSEIDSICAATNRRNGRTVPATVVFIENIVANSRRAGRPVYFLGTVAPEYRAGFDDSLVSEGLVLRVASGEVERDSVDLPRSISNVLGKYRLNRMNEDVDWTSNYSPLTRDPSPMRINYAVVLLDIARQCALVYDTANGLKASDIARCVKLDPQHRSQLLFMLSRHYAGFGKASQSRVLLDSAIVLSGKDPQTDPATRFQVDWLHALNLRAEGRAAEAESAYVELGHMAPELIWDLFDLYLKDMGDTTKAVSLIRQWYDNVGRSWENMRRLARAFATRLQNRAEAIRVIDDWLREHPAEAERARRLRSSLL